MPYTLGVPHYSELLPIQLTALWAEGAPAIVPWGALEWHGGHLPLGLDGIVAEWFAGQLAERINGVLLPGVWLPMTTLPHKLSIPVKTETFRLLLDDLLQALFESGARKICIVTGHYAQGHQIEMSEAALRSIDDNPGLLVLCATPLELLADEHLLDHAAHYETAQLLAIRPDLVHLVLVKPGPISVHESPILGDAPGLASSTEGLALLNRGLDSWEQWIKEASAGQLEGHYKAVFDRYAPYVDAYYKGSWEDAMKIWWAKKGNPI